MDDMVRGRKELSGIPTDVALQAALDEPGDLSRHERLQILAAFRDLQKRNHWELLGLVGDPTTADIKRTFFEASKQFHPDRFFGKDLGSFAPKLNAVFRGIKEAYDVLADRQTREVYQREHPPPSAKPASVPDGRRGRFQAAPVRPKAPARPAAPRPKDPDPERTKRLEARRQQIEAERRAKKRVAAGSAVSGRSAAARAKQHYEDGIQMLAQHRVVDAANSLQLAVTFAPDNGEYRMRLEDVEALALRARCDEHVHRAELAMASGQVQTAAREYREASDLLPSAASYAMRAAELLARSDDLEAGLVFARRAVEASPNRKQARLLLAELLEKNGAQVEASAHVRAATWMTDEDSKGNRSQT